MADEAVQNEAPEEGKPNRLMAGLLLAGALIVGGGAGVVVVGPMAADRLSASPAEGASADAEHDAGKKESGKKGSKKGGHGKDGHGASGATHYTLESLVLNPAETKGTRFLMATIVLDVGGESDIEALAGRDPEVRDRLMSVLGGKTVDELTDVARRDSLKSEIRDAVSELIGGDKIHAVYLPTFVIQ